MSEGTRSPSQVIQSDNRPQKPLLWVGPENAERRRLAGSAAGGCGNGWEGLLVPSSISPGGNVEQPSASIPVADDCDAARGGTVGYWTSPGVSQVTR